MRIVLLGAPGAGKGTQGIALAEQFGVLHVSSGELLRAEMDADTDLGREVRGSVSRGELVPDDLVLSIVGRAVNEAMQSGGYIQEDPFSLPGNKIYLLRDDIQASENLRLLTTYSVITPDRYWEGVFTPPVNGPLSSPFGSTRLFNGIATKRHTGYDFKVPSGTPILASASGRVVLSRPMDIHGNNVVFDHGWGVFSEYAHMSVRYVVPGQFVLQGDVIGLSGTTGRSTGPHVHWEIAVNGVWVNPLQFMQVRIPS